MALEEHPVIRALRGIRKVIINSEHGGFGLSDEACRRYLELSQITWEERDGQYAGQGPLFYVNDQFWSDRDIDRDDPVLIRVIEELGDRANGRYAQLKIIEIPADVEWYIEEYDGKEHVAETHRTWQ